MVSDYLEEDLSAISRTVVEDHLARCEHCTVYVQQIRHVIALVGSTGESEASSAAPTASRKGLGH